MSGATTLEKRLAVLERAADRLTAQASTTWTSPLALADSLGLTLDSWQRDVLTSPSRQILMLCSRQSGKSTVSAVMGLHEALSVPRSLTLIVSPGERQSGLLFRTLSRFYRQLGEAVPADIENRLSLELSNGSAIYALPGIERTVRGFSSVNLIIEDEASRVDDALYGAVRPMLAVTGGRIVLASTPFGRRGHFYEEYTKGGPDWHRVRVTAFDCPRIPRDWLLAERDRIGGWLWDQEFGVEFKDNDDQMFASEHVDAALIEGSGPLLLPMFATERAA